MNVFLDVFTPALEGANFKDVEGADFKLAKILNNPASTGGCSGMILLPKNTEKPASTSDVTIFGYVVAGEIEVTINKTVAVLGRGCSFVIPKGMWQFIIDDGDGWWYFRQSIQVQQQISTGSKSLFCESAVTSALVVIFILYLIPCCMILEWLCKNTNK